MKKVAIIMILLIFLLHLLSYQIGKEEGIRQEKKRYQIEKDTIFIIIQNKDR